MKIGILTFHCAHNYGAVLQCYALQEALKGLGHKVDVIDYRPSSIRNNYEVISWHRIVSRNPIKLLKRCASEFLGLFNRVKRYRAFEHFIRQKLNLSFVGISSEYDVYIMGSDQIWNPSLTDGFDPIYLGYLPFPKEGRKYVAYAASMETEALDDAKKSYLVSALCNFDAISVREKQLANLLRPLTTKKIHITLDPTLLVDPSVWFSLIQSHPLKNKKYVLVYQVREDNNTYRIARHIANQINAQIVTIAAYASWHCKDWLYQAESPEAFVNWIKHASCVVSTSFHGIAFSVLCERNFYYVSLGKGDTRVSSLLGALGLENRMIGRTSLPVFQEVDYNQTMVEKKLDAYRKESFNFLMLSMQ